MVGRRGTAGGAGGGTVSDPLQVTNEAGKKRETSTDALGRLIKVVEDPAGLAAGRQNLVRLWNQWVVILNQFVLLDSPPQNPSWRGVIP